MPDHSWDLLGFMDALRVWTDYDPPPGDLLTKVAAFGGELERDPERDFELDHANFYLREIPGTEHNGRIVTISFELSRPKPRGPGEVRCKNIACLAFPQRELLPAWPPPRHH